MTLKTKVFNEPFTVQKILKNNKYGFKYSLLEDKLMITYTGGAENQSAFENNGKFYIPLNEIIQ